MSTGPLAGRRIFDLTRFVSGSYATSLLASLGAEVLKIEVPPGGDSYRGQATETIGGESALFLSLNGGKRSVALDFRAPEAYQAVDQILGSCDVLVHNSRPGSLAGHRLDHGSVSARHPHLVYAAISGYGDVGPDSDRGGFDLILQAESGLMSITGHPAVGPVKVGAPVLDIGAGLCAVVGILAALTERDRTGHGSYVTSSLLEFALAGLTTLSTPVLAGGEVPALLGSHSPSFAPYGAFQASDDYLVLAGAGSERLWVRLCEVIDRPELVADERFATNKDRVANRDALTAVIEAALADDTVDAWVAKLEASGVPAGRVRSIEEVLASDQVNALGSIQEPDHPIAGRYSTLGVPFRIDSERPPTGPAPVFGADTRAVLDETGVDAAVIESLFAGGQAVQP